MEREEKAIRLQLKILRRRSKEGQIRQVTVDQRREERERLAMAREERHARLHIKFCARQLSKRRQQLATASTTAEETESQPPSTSSSRHEGHTRRRSSVAKSRKSTAMSKNGSDASSEDDGDMSFLDIDFTIPDSMKPRKTLGNNAGAAHSKKPRVSSTKTLAKMKKRPGGKKSRSTTIRAPGREVGTSLGQVDAEEQEDCGYGDEFDDVVDEAALSHLIC
jgi:hypothetical protein